MPQNCDYNRLAFSLAEHKGEQSIISVYAGDRVFSEGKRDSVLNTLQLQEKLKLFWVLSNAFEDTHLRFLIILPI